MEYAVDLPILDHHTKKYAVTVAAINDKQTQAVVMTTLEVKKGIGTSARIS